MPKASFPNNCHQRRRVREVDEKQILYNVHQLCNLNCGEIKQHFILTEVYSSAEVKPFRAFKPPFLSHIFLYVRYLTFIFFLNKWSPHTHGKRGLAFLAENRRDASLEPQTLIKSRIRQRNPFPTGLSIDLRVRVASQWQTLNSYVVWEVNLFSQKPVIRTNCN